MTNIIVVFLGLLLNGLLEWFTKESWVIKSTFDRSFKMMLNVLDENENEIFVV